MITIKGPPARIQELGAQLDAIEGLPKPAVATVRYAEQFDEDGNKKVIIAARFGRNESQKQDAFVV